MESSERKRVEALKRRDAEVRRHEQAYLTSAGGYARSGASYQYVTSRDGKGYAVGGEVSIDVSEIPGDPDATIRKAQIVRRAALAPANPSPQDCRIACEASLMETKARQELARLKQAEQEQYNEAGKPAGDGPPAVTVEHII